MSTRKKFIERRVKTIWLTLAEFFSLINIVFGVLVILFAVCITPRLFKRAIQRKYSIDRSAAIAKTDIGKIINPLPLLRRKSDIENPYVVDEIQTDRQLDIQMANQASYE